MASLPNNKAGNGKRSPMRIVGIAVAVVVIALVAVWFRVARGDNNAGVKVATFAAKRGPLTISVPVSGTVKAREQEVIYNQVEGRTSIVWIIPEGTQVKKGEKLIELDTSTLRDQEIDQDIKVQNARATQIDANETLAVTQNQAISDVNKADLDLFFAHEDLKKYSDPNKGEYHNLLVSSDSDIQLADEELKRAEETLTWSKRLFDEKYISQTELQADTLSRSRSNAKLTLAQNSKTLLEQYTYRRQMAKLTSDVYQAQMALERSQRKAKADVVQAEANLNAKNQEYEREKFKLAKIKDQLAKAIVYSPTDAMVIYATSAQRGGGRGFDNRQPLQEGVEVFERQELFYLPTAQSCKAEVAIHESSLQKVRLGLPARITVDALPGKEFIGTVARIAPLPDPQSMWMNPDLKVYNSDVYLDESDPELRTGMNCKVEIIVARYDDAVYVPVHTVNRVDGKPTIYVLKEDGTMEPRTIEIGLDNNSMVRVISGLQEGEPVVQDPPLKAATLGPNSEGPGRDANAPVDSMTQRINQRLESAANGTQGLTQGISAGGSQDGEAGQRRGRGRRSSDPNNPQGIGAMRSMTPEQRQQMMQNMTPEQRQQMEAMRQQFENMTPEQREAARQRFQQGGGRQGRGQGQGGDQGSGGQGQGFGGQGQGQGQGFGGQGQGGGQGTPGGRRSRSGGGD
jgi:HlyD family secretion protein